MTQDVRDFIIPLALRLIANIVVNNQIVDKIAYLVIGFLQPVKTFVLNSNFCGSWSAEPRRFVESDKPIIITGVNAMSLILKY